MSEGIVCSALFLLNQLPRELETKRGTTEEAVYRRRFQFLTAGHVLPRFKSHNCVAEFCLIQTSERNTKQER